MAAGNPPINWGNPQTLEGFLWLIGGGPYRGLVFDVQPSAVFQRLGYVSRLLVTQFTPLGVGIGLFGLAEGRMRCWNGVLAWIFLASVIYAVGYNTNDSFVYLIPAWIAAAV